VPIVINLDVMLARRKMRLTELSERVGITMANLSNLKTAKARAIRFTTLEAICAALDCQPGDLIEYRPSEKSPRSPVQEGRSPISVSTAAFGGSQST
jgi:putative transcriptional regulator